MWSTTDSYSSGLDSSLKMFSHITTKLDGIRSQSFFDVYPEHINIKNYLIHNQLNIEIPKNELSGFNK